MPDLFITCPRCAQFTMELMHSDQYLCTNCHYECDLHTIEELSTIAYAMNPDKKEEDN